MTHDGLSSPMGVSANSLADKYLAVVGAASTMLIFNQFNIGGNISIIWLMACAFPIIKQRFNFSISFSFLLLFLIFVSFKFILAGNISAVVRYAIYILTLISILLSFDRRDFASFFKGFEIGLGLNVGFALLQMAGELTGVYRALLKPSVWNPYLWHYNPPGGMFTFWPRVSGFSNEPAYLGLLFIANAAYRTFIAEKQTLTGKYGIYLFLVIILLVNSRTAFYGYVFLAIGALIVRFRDHPAIKPVAVVTYIASFIIMPAFLIHSTSDFRSLQEMLRQDVSVFARSVPLRWPLTPEYFSFWEYAFGVSDYSAFAQNLPIPQIIRSMFVSQGMFSDSKSLGGAYFYDFGLVGAAIFIVALGQAYRWNTRALLFYAVINVGFFNVYAFSWPLFWICVATGAVVPFVSARTNIRGSALPTSTPTTYGYRTMTR